jgi:hypothetical protein
MTKVTLLKWLKAFPNGITLPSELFQVRSWRRWQCTEITKNSGQESAILKPFISIALDSPQI